MKLGDFGLVKKLRHAKITSPYIADPTYDFIYSSLPENFGMDEDTEFTLEEKDMVDSQVIKGNSSRGEKV